MSQRIYNFETQKNDFYVKILKNKLMTLKKKEQLERKKDRIFLHITEKYLLLLSAVEKKFARFDEDFDEKDFDDSLKSMINVNKFMNDLPGVFDKIFMSESFKEDDKFDFVSKKLTEEEKKTISGIIRKAVYRE